MYLKYFVFFTLCLNVVCGQSPCKTPDGNNGECISILNCSPLLNLVSKNNRTAQETNFLKSSKCGYDGKYPLVCCLTCRTPDGGTGKCISINSCLHIANMLIPPVTQEKKDYVLQSQNLCTGSPGTVCCGAAPTDSCEAQMSAYPPDPKTQCCGIEDTVPSKLAGYGGEVTKIDNHPWAAIIEYVTEKNTTKLSCGGSLISGKYVLTAGHCIAGQILKNSKPHTVRLGEYDITHEGPDCDTRLINEVDCNDGVTRILIEKTIPHPEYNPIDPRRRNDIGLIRLKETAPYTSFIRPICLPSKDWTSQQNVPHQFIMFAVGWGATSASQPFSPLKVHVQLPFVDYDKCQKAYSTGGRSTDLWKGQLCAGGVHGKDTCKGDSGGPLVYEKELQHFEVTGIVSFGPTPCGLEGVPGVYTNVYEYLDWIKSTIVP